MNRKNIFLTVAIVATIVFCFSLYEEFALRASDSAYSATSYETASTTLTYGVPIRIIKVIDGDTVALEGGAHLRYIGIDTPEEVKPNTPVQCYAVEAAAENRRLVENKDVTIYKDVNSVDMYGRYLGFVYLPDGTMVNEMLIKEGFAFAYKFKPDISKSAQFAADEKQAKAAGLGLWSHCEVYKEASGREQTNAI